MVPTDSSSLPCGQPSGDHARRRCYIRGQSALPSYIFSGRIAICGPLRSSCHRHQMGGKLLPMISALLTLFLAISGHAGPTLSSASLTPTPQIIGTVTATATESMTPTPNQTVTKTPTKTPNWTATISPTPTWSKTPTRRPTVPPTPTVDWTPTTIPTTTCVWKRTDPHRCGY